MVIGNFMFTVTQLARKYDISSATILYYERAGLLTPAYRSDNGYSWYGDSEIEQLEAIVSYCLYRIPVANIGDLLDRKKGISQFQILTNHLNELGKCKTKFIATDVNDSKFFYYIVANSTALAMLHIARIKCRAVVVI